MITIYSKPSCTYSDQAKALLEMKGIEYNELIVGSDVTAEQLKSLVPGAKSVPQIMDDGIYVGGYKELVGHLDGQSK